MFILNQFEKLQNYPPVANPIFAKSLYKVKQKLSNTQIYSTTLVKNSG